MSPVARLAACTAACLASFAVHAGEPRVVLLERNPWLMVSGADSPTFALYSDGQVIFRARDANASPSGYLETRLPPAEYEALVARISPEATARLAASYTASTWTDQPGNELYVWVDGRRKSVFVYGRLRKDAAARSLTPPAFLRAFDEITRFSVQANPWLPDSVEVLIWPYDHSPEQPLPWPADWPSFEHSRGGSSLRHVSLEGRRLGQLQTFIRSLRPKQAVSLANRKWAISYRLALPQETAWTH